MIKKFLEEFKEFALKGSVIDMAVGVVIGGAFKGIVDSLVNDIINPLIGLIANQDFSALSVKVRDVPIMYGSFISTIINFVLMAFVIFVVIKLINETKKLTTHPHEVVEAPTTKKCPYCLSEIPIEATKCAHCTADIIATAEANA